MSKYFSKEVKKRNYEIRTRAIDQVLAEEGYRKYKNSKYLAESTDDGLRFKIKRNVSQIASLGIKEANTILMTTSENLYKLLKILILQDLEYIEPIITKDMAKEHTFETEMLGMYETGKFTDVLLNAINGINIKKLDILNNIAFNQQIEEVMSFYSIQIEQLKDLCSKITYSKKDKPAIKKLIDEIDEINPDIFNIYFKMQNTTTSLN